MGKQENITPESAKAMEETFNLAGLRDYDGSLIGRIVIPNGSPNPKEPFGAGYDLEMVHRDLQVQEPFNATTHPLTVKADFEENNARFLTVEDHRGEQANVLAERLILA